MIAAGSVASALHGLGWTRTSGVTLPDLLRRLHIITAIEQDYLQSCVEQIEEMLAVAMGGATTRGAVDPATLAANKLQGEKAGTPTDVRDVHF